MAQSVVPAMRRTRHRIALALTLALVLVAAADPPVVDAQRAERLHRIGMLERTSMTNNTANVESFRRGMRDLGYTEGKTFVVEYRSAEGRDERYASLAAELVEARVDLILTRGTPAALAVKKATTTTPVVIVGVGDPVGQGIVASLAHPGGNITGLSAAVTDIYPKRVQLLKELVPRAMRIGGLFNMSNPALPPQWREIEVASRSLGLDAHLLDVRKPEDLEPAFDAATRQRIEALIVGLDTLTQTHQHAIVALAARRRLPAIYASAEFADGLMAYGVNYPETYRHAASYVHRILKGTRPADLPVEEPTKLELVINVKAASAIGLTIPPALLLRADRVTQ